MSAVQHISHERDSLDKFILDIRDLGVDVTATQLDRHTQPNLLEVVSTASTTVMRYEVGNRIHHLLGAGQGCRTFGFLAGRQASTRIGSREFGSQDMLQVDPGCGLDAVIEAGFAGYTFSIREECFQQVATLHGVEDAAILSQGMGTERPVPEAYQTQLRRSLKQMISIARTDPQAMAVREFLDLELPALLLHGWCYEQLPRREDCPLASRSRILRGAVEIIRAEGGETVTVERLCRETASSYSTLERAFRERFGVSPKRYLTLSRLSAVRRGLLSDEHRTVTDIAHACGFTHMGKFAADYHRQFGELPSRTRRP